MESLKGLYLDEEALTMLLQESLAAGQSVRYLPFRGRSMLPLLRQGKDAVQLSPLPQQLKKYDLPVYRYPDGRYVMHRIVRVENDCCICLGDNTYRYERVTKEMMLGIVTAIRQGNRVISVDSCHYRAYCRIWCGLYPLRLGLWRGKNWLRRWLK